MPLTEGDLQPGDLVLCYGWNAVGTLQGAARTLKRIIDVASLPQSLPLRVGNPVPYFGGTAKCNHALVVGTSMENIVADDVVIPFAAAAPGERANLRKEGERVFLRRTLRGEAREEEITDFCAQHGQPDVVMLLDAKIQIAFKRQRTAYLVRLCHSTGGGCHWVTAASYLAGHAGSIAAYRLAAGGRSADLAREAGAVAATWALDVGARPGVSQYSNWKAFWSAFGSHTFGSNASARARKYREHRARVGGPPSDADPTSRSPFANRTGNKEWFCSMFAIACYQAATQDDAECRTYLPLDAKRTTPMTLDGLVSTSPRWRLVGRSP